MLCTIGEFDLRKEGFGEFGLRFDLLSELVSGVLYDFTLGWLYTMHLYRCQCFPDGTFYEKYNDNVS